MTKYVDDKIEYIQEDTLKIRTRPSMYISYKGSKGALHLAKEVINNAIDECISRKSPGNYILIEFDEGENRLTVMDNGRGIPLDKVELVCTKIQAGSKLYREADTQGVDNKSFTAGENGVGITAVNALSHLFRFDIYHNDRKGVFVFSEGNLVSKEITDIPPVKNMVTKHGTTVTFIPSEEILGKCKINLKELRDWVSNISYLVDPNISIEFCYFKKGSDVMKSEKFRHTDGVKDLLKDFNSKSLFEPIYVNFKGSYRILDNGAIEFQEEDPKHPDFTLGDDIVIQAAFTFNPDVHTDEDTHYMSFCNYVNTIDHGVHLNACKKAWCQFLVKACNDALSDTEAKKYQVSFDDARAGLFAVVNVMCDNPQFASQTKEKISNDDLFRPISWIVTRYITKFFKNNPAVLKRAITFVKTNMKARMEIGKIRKSEYRPIDSLSENTLKCFNPANGDGYKELFIVEGRSAKGSLVIARDARTQALFSLRGVPKNVNGLKLAEILANEEFKYLVKCLGCGIGQDFDMKKLRYDKIIIFTDSDIDGFRIASLICTFFITQYPEIVTRGMLYKAVAPLYIIDDPKHPYILNKSKYYEYFADKMVKAMTVTKHGKELSRSELKKLIIQNSSYLSLLKALVNYYSVNPDIIEFLVFIMGSNINQKTLQAMIKKHFPEMQLTDDEFKGVYQGGYQMVSLDKTFYNRSKRLKELMNQNEDNVYDFIDSKTGISQKGITLGQLLRYAKRYMPFVKARIKGLGEMNPAQLWDSSLNPETRELIQLTSDNIETELAKFNVLHGKDADLRKELMREYILDIEDIDN